MVHPTASTAGVTVVHVTAFNDLFWDCGERRTRVIEHGIVDPGDRFTGELPQARRRHQRTGSARPGHRYGSAVPLRRRRPGRPVRHRRRPGSAGSRTCRRQRCTTRWRGVASTCTRCAGRRSGSRCSRRCTSGCRSSALATTEVPDAVPAGAGVVSTSVDVLVDAARRLVADPEEARVMGKSARAAALRSLRARSLPRRLGRTVRGGDLMSSESRRPTRRPRLRARQPAGSARRRRRRRQNVHVAALAEHLARRGLASRRVHTARRPGPASPGPAVPRRVRRPRRCRAGDTAAQGRAAAAHVDLRRRAASHVVGSSVRTSSTPTSGCPVARHWTAGRDLGLPVVQTFHALGVVKRRQQGDAGHQPAGSPGHRSAARAHGRPRHRHVHRRGVRARQARWRSHAHVRRPVRGRRRARSHPTASVERRRLARRLVVVSRLVERKGIGNVIAALAEIPDTELVIAGGPERTRVADDPEARRLLRLAEAHGVAERVELRGQLRRHELPPLLRSADAVVCVPWYEPFGIVPLEAMACARPVRRQCGRRSDRHRRRRRDGRARPAARRRTGWPTPCVASSATRAAAERMGRAGRLRVEERYGWERVADATLACYRARSSIRRRRQRRRRSGEEVSDVDCDAVDQRSVELRADRAASALEQTTPSGSSSGASGSGSSSPPAVACWPSATVAAPRRPPHLIGRAGRPLRR